jgi:hypothetical protein
MISGITAVVLSANSYVREFPGLHVLVLPGKISDSRELYATRLGAVNKVQTSHFFFLDDDDDLPPDYLEVLRDCLQTNAALCYTDEIIRNPLDGYSFVSKKQEYSQDAHLAFPLLVHHLVLYSTHMTVKELPNMPEGNHCPEYIMAWQMAKKGAAYVPRIGYIWNKHPSAGLHRHPAIIRASIKSIHWAAANRT